MCEAHLTMCVVGLGSMALLRAGMNVSHSCLRYHVMYTVMEIPATLKKSAQEPCLCLRVAAIGKLCLYLTWFLHVQPPPQTLLALGLCTWCVHRYHGIWCGKRTRKYRQVPRKPPGELDLSRLSRLSRNIPGERDRASRESESELLHGGGSDIELEHWEHMGLR